MQPILDLLGRHCHGGTLELEAPNGRQWRFGRGDDTARVSLRDPAVLRWILRNPRLRFAEAYMAGDWTPADSGLADVLRVCMRNMNDLQRSVAWLRAWTRTRDRLGELNSSWRARANVSHHYDIHYDVYRRFLDRDLNYSCAYFQRPDMSLEEAQRAKCAHIAAKLDLKPGARVLDIGCGWGSLAMYLAERHDARCIGVTLSEEQLKIARARAREFGLDDRVTFRLQDYRDDFAGDEAPFDAVVSVGMFEHVGRPQYDTFFRRIHELLSEDGTALVHTIGRYSPPAAGGVDPWIRKYIFPGGYIPAASEMLGAVEANDLIGGDLEYWRLHYALTLDHWNDRFQSHRGEIADRMGERFCRMWEFYLQACAAAFRHGDLAVFQVQLAKRLDRLPLTRDYLYTADPAEISNTPCRLVAEPAANVGG